MKRQQKIIIIILIFFPLLSMSQNEGNKILYKDSVMLDSVKVVNEKFLFKINKFYNRSKDVIDSNTYFVLENLRYKDSCKNYFEISISLVKDIDNDFMISQNWNSCYFKINNVLVLIRHIEDEYSFDLLFQKTKKEKLFYFNQKEYIKFGVGFKATMARYKVIINKKNDLKIKELYYVKHAPSRFKRLYYRIRYRKYW